MRTLQDDNWTDLTILPDLERKQAQYGGLRVRSRLLPEPHEPSQLPGLLGVATFWAAAITACLWILWWVGNGLAWLLWQLVSAVVGVLI